MLAFDRLPVTLFTGRADPPLRPRRDQVGQLEMAGRPAAAGDPSVLAVHVDDTGLPPPQILSDVIEVDVERGGVSPR